MMKKTMVIFLMSLVVFSLTACGNTTTTNQSSTDVTVSTTDSSESSKETKEAKTSSGGLGNESANTALISRQFTDVPYGTVSSTQTLNVYLPSEGEGPFPVIIAIHGGAFKMGNATGGDVAAMLEGVNRGYAVVSINYRLSGEAIFPAAVNDCKAAIRFIKANATTYHINPDKIAVWGDSAGGNLAAMVGTSGNVDELNGDNVENLEFDSTVQVVIDWFGPLNFLKMDEQFAAAGITPKFGKTSSESSPESQYIGQLITNDPELTLKANPETYIETMDLTNAPKFYIQHGTADSNVPSQQSIDFAAALKTAIGEENVKLELLDGAGHGTEEFTATSNLDKVFEFLDQYLK